MAYDPLTGKKYNYRTSDIIRATAPTVKQRYFQGKSLGLQEDSLQQSADQFNQSLELQKKQAKEAQDQAAISQGIASLGLAKETYPYAKKGVTGLSRLITGSQAKGEAAINDLFTPSYTGTTIDYTAPTGAGEAAVPTGYAPLASEAIPAGYSAGESAILNAVSPSYTSPAYDALLAEGAGDIGGTGAVNAAGAGEAALAGDAAAASSGGAGSVLSGIGAGVSTAVPYYALAKLGGQLGQKVFEGQEPGLSVEGFGPGVAESLNRPLNVEQYWAEQAGAPEGVQVALDLLNPLGPAENIISDALGTHWCTIINKVVGIAPFDIEWMKTFRMWCLANHPEYTQFYIDNFDKVVSKTKESIENHVEFFKELKTVLVDKIVELMKADDIKSAYKVYHDKSFELMKQYCPELLKSYQEIENA